MYFWVVASIANQFRNAGHVKAGLRTQHVTPACGSTNVLMYLLTAVQWFFTGGLDTLQVLH